MSAIPPQEVPSHGPRPWREKLKSAASIAFLHARRHAGVGIVCAVAYFDPGNWGVDLQAGSQFGYRLLFVVLLAGLFAVFLQCLATRLGCVTGLDLATHCRLWLHDRPKHTLVYRWLFHYPLYILAEIAIISTDLAELLGSAIALCMIFPKMPLWAGVLLTAFDVLLILALGDPLRGRPVRMFELLIACLVLTVLVSMAIIIAKVDVDWADAFEGYIPSKYIFQSGGLYTSVGILGATIMPHSLFLGSALSTQDRLSPLPEKLSSEKSEDDADDVDLQTKVPVCRFSRLWMSTKEYLRTTFSFSSSDAHCTRPRRHSDRENNELAFVKAHLYHGIVDIVSSLLGFAVLINSLILILASAVFFYGKSDTGSATPASLFDAHDLIRDLVGKPAAFLFALALLAAGQSASLIATVAGQAVSEGFLQWKVSPVIRRLSTRLLSLIPSMAVAIAVGRPGIDALLVISQVILSIVLPFITFPLIYLTSSKSIMRVRKPQSSASVSPDADTDADTNTDTESGDAWEDFSNSKITMGIGFAIWLVVLTANMYVIVSLGMGNNG